MVLPAPSFGSTTLRLSVLDTELVPFLALSRTEQRTSASPAKGWAHLLDKCGARACSKSQLRHRLRIFGEQK